MCDLLLLVWWFFRDPGLTEADLNHRRFLADARRHARAAWWRRLRGALWR